ncbi:Plug domain-containing protein [Caulobacter segnis]
MAKKANVSFSVIDEDDMSKFTPISADDMLRDMPGVVVESNDGVARNEVFTRGMTIGTGANTSGTTSGRLSWKTACRSCRSSSAASRTAISTAPTSRPAGWSHGARRLVGDRRDHLGGRDLQLHHRSGEAGRRDPDPGRLRGRRPAPSWKQVDGAYGWINKTGDFGVGLSGFYRRSNGQVKPGWDLNHGGQFKVNLYKDYATSSGSGLVQRHRQAPGRLPTPS